MTHSSANMDNPIIMWCDATAASEHVTTSKNIFCSTGAAASSARHVQLLAAGPETLYGGVAVPKLLETVKNFLDVQRNFTHDDDDGGFNKTCTADCLIRAGSDEDKRFLYPTPSKSPLFALLQRLSEPVQHTKDSIVDDEMISSMLDSDFKDSRSGQNGPAPAKVMHQKIMDLIRSRNFGTGFDLDIAYFDQVCKLTQPMASCLDDCAEDRWKNASDIAKSLVEFLCVDRVQTAKTNSNCLKRNLFRRSKFCVTKCNKMETSMQESSQIFVISSQTVDLRHGAAKNVCKYTKCIAACFMPTIGSDCGKETADITKDIIAKGMEAFKEAFNLVGDEATACTLSTVQDH